MQDVDLSRMPLFEGLDAAALLEIAARMQPRRFRPRAFVCRQGEPGSSLLVIQDGLAQVMLDQPEGAAIVARLRRGDVIGEMSLLTGEPRSASVQASVPTDVLELSQDAFAALLARHPTLLANLSRILSRRLARANVQPFQSRRRGEAVALVVDPGGASLAADAIEATRAASPGTVGVVDLTGSLPHGTLPLPQPTVAGVLGQLDSCLAAHTTVIAVLPPEQENLPLLFEHVDRIVIFGAETEIQRPAAILGPNDAAAEVVLLSPHPRQAPRSVGGLRVVRALDPDGPAQEIAWLGRYLSRTRLGLALGAGGAKGYAHVGALHVLQEAGYTVDFVAGSSIGALVGAWLALGMDAAEIEAAMRRTFTPETVPVLFRGTMSGQSAGGDLMTRLWRETTNDRSFADLAIPLTAMTVDLNAGLPAPITEGPLWQALLASMAIPGLFPPFERGEQRLVDGVALVPVPTTSVMEAGADIVISVNIMNREKRTGGPGEPEPERPPTERHLRLVDALMDVMELTWRDSSIRQAALADVVITPRFGPGTWRSFHLADQYLAAGREATKAQLASLAALAKPPKPSPQAPLQPVGEGWPKAGVRPSAADGGREPPRFTFNDLKDILVRLIRVPAADVLDDLNATFTDLGLDSISFLEIQIEMEQRYGFHISDEEAQQIHTLGEAIDLVNRRLQELT
jgi:NTE family protein